MTQNLKGAWGRAIVGYVDKNLCGYSHKSFAEYFHRDSVAMSRGIAKVEGRAGTDKDFGRKLRRLERVITLGQKRKIRNESCLIPKFHRRYYRFEQLSDHVPLFSFHWHHHSQLFLFLREKKGMTL